MTSVINPADFKYCITIDTPSYNKMYALSNDDNLTYGDVLTGILHELNYTIIGGESHHKTEHMFLQNNGIDQMDLSKKVDFDDNKTNMSIIFDRRALNHKPFPAEQTKEYICSRRTCVSINPRDIDNVIAKIKSSNVVTLFIKNLHNQVTTYYLPLDATVYDWKIAIYLNNDLPPDQQRLVFNGKQLDDTQKLYSYGIQINSMVHMVLRLRGGMFQDYSGRAGNYKPIQKLCFSLDNRDITKHYIPDKPILMDSSKDYDKYKNPHEYVGIGKLQEES